MWRRGRPRAKFETPFGTGVVAYGKSRLAKIAERLLGATAEQIARKFQIAVEPVVTGLAGGFPCSERAKFRNRNLAGAFRAVAGRAAVDSFAVVETFFLRMGFHFGAFPHHDTGRQKKRTPKNQQKTLEERAFHWVG